MNKTRLVPVIVATGMCVAALAKEGALEPESPQARFSAAIGEINSQATTMTSRQRIAAIDQLVDEHLGGDVLLQMRSATGAATTVTKEVNTNNLDPKERELHELQLEFSTAIQTIQESTEDPRMRCSLIDDFMELNHDLSLRQRSLRDELQGNVNARSQSFQAWHQRERDRLAIMDDLTRTAGEKRIDLAEAIEQARLEYAGDPRALSAMIDLLVGQYR